MDYEKVAQALLVNELRDALRRAMDNSVQTNDMDERTCIFCGQDGLDAGHLSPPLVHDPDCPMLRRVHLLGDE